MYLPSIEIHFSNLIELGQRPISTPYGHCNQRLLKPNYR